MYPKSFSFLPLPLEHFPCLHDSTIIQPCLLSLAFAWQEYVCLLKEPLPELKLSVSQRLRLLLGPSCEEEGEGRTGSGHSLLCYYSASITVFVNLFIHTLKVCACQANAFGLVLVLGLSWYESVKKDDTKYLNYLAIILPALELTRPTLYFPLLFVCGLSVYPCYAAHDQASSVCLSVSTNT